MEDIISSIALCQKKLEKYSSNYDEAKLTYYLSKLKHLPIKVSHLEQTGVGRSVNALRHITGSVGDRARNLVGVWKKMVTAEEGSSGREQHDRSDRRSSGAAVLTARASPRPSKQQPPTSQSPEEVEDDEDCERLQIEEATDDCVEDVCGPPSPERLDPNCYDPSKPATEFSDRLNTNGNKYLPKGSGYERSGSDSDRGSPSYDPYTSRQDYQNAGVSNEPIEYQPTPVVSPGEQDEERGGTPILSAEEEAKEEPSESAECSQDSKSKNKHKDKKKHKGRDKEKSSKDKHRHKSSEKDKDKSHKDKRKDKDRSPSKKSKNSSDQIVASEKDDLDRRRSKSHKSSDNDYYSPNSSVDNSLVNGHVLPDIVTVDTNSVATSNKDESSSKHASSKSSSSHSKESKKEDKEKKDKKDKKRTRDTDSDHQAKNDHKSKKRKSDDQEGFGAALMGLNKESPSKQKKSKSHSKDKDDKSHKSKSSSSSKNSSSKSHNSSGHSSRPTSEKQGSSSGSQAPLAAPNSPPAPPPELDVISPNYKPLPRVPLPESLNLDDLETYPSFLPTFMPVTEAPQLTQEQTLDRMLTSKGKTKRQIYSGKARTSEITDVPSLFNLAVKCLQENIDALEFTGGIPYDLLKPVFEKATATQLFNLENYNPYLLEDTHPLWEQHCKKDFKRNKPEEMETYRDMYMRLLDERTQKLKSLTETLQSKFVTKPPPRRTTQLAFVGTVAKPPKNVARAQAKYGTGVPVGTPAKTTKAAEILARKHAMQNVQRVERTAGGGASNGPGARPSASSKKPRAPLMAKTMQFYKKTFRR